MLLNRNIARKIVAGGASILAVGALAWWLAPNRYASSANAATDADLLDWPARGDLATNQQVIREATDTWGQVGSHHGIRVLWAGTDPRRGSVVVLQGRDATGQPRLGILTGGGEASGPHWLRDDRPVPDPAHTNEISLLSKAPPSHGSDYRPMDIIVLAEPGAYVEPTQSPAWQQEGQSSSFRPLRVESWRNATPQNFTIHVVGDSGKIVYRGSVDRMGAFDHKEPLGGFIDSVAVWYLPDGFRLVGKPQFARLGDITTATARYEDANGAFITVAVARGASADVRVFDLPGDQDDGGHPARGKPAHVAKQADGAVRYSWEERPGMAIAVTGTEPKALASSGQGANAVPVSCDLWTVAEIADALQPLK